MEYESLKIYDAFHEVSVKLEEALEDGILDIGEKEDIIRWCKDYSYMNPVGCDATTLAVRRLHGFLHGLVLDQKLTDEEIKGLEYWLKKYRPFKFVWPFNELNSLVDDILEDGKVDEDERSLLFDLCSEFSEKIVDGAVLHDDFYKILGDQKTKVFEPLGYITEENPQIEFEKCLFCFTGPAKTGKRRVLQHMVSSMGGSFVDRIDQLDNGFQHIDYMVIGAYSSPAWVYSTYGRKIEKVVEMQRKGKPVKIIKEEDFISQIPENIVGECLEKYS